MKHSLLTLMSLLLLAFPAAAQVDYNSPAQYNDFIVGEQTKIINANIEYNSELIHGEDEKKAETMRNEVIRQVQKSQQAIKNMPPFKGDTKLKDQAITTLNLYLETYRMEFNEANILKKTREESYEAMENYLKTVERAEQKLKQANDQLNAAQKEFARKNDLNLEANTQMEGRIELVGRLNVYQRQIFLTYFKVSKAEAKFMDAMNGDKKNELEYARKALEKTAAEAQEALKGMTAFDGDDSYRKAALDFVNFYYTLATTHFVTFSETARKEERTQADVDAYNAAVEAYNNGMMKYGNAYNETHDRFMRAHYPASGSYR